MGQQRVEILLGAPPVPEVITADVIRNLRSPAGAAPCAEGLRAALAWIGDRTLPITEAIAEARRNRRVSKYLDWALDAIGYGISYSYGYGDDYGFGYGDGFGIGFGDGYGSGYSDGDGSGFGEGYGFGYVDGSGYGRRAANAHDLPAVDSRRAQGGQS